MENVRSRFETEEKKAALRREMLSSEINRLQKNVAEFLEDAEYRIDLAGAAKTGFERRCRIEERDASLYQAEIYREMIAALKAIQ